MEKRKIIFTCLGPDRTYRVEDIEYRDGDVAEVDEGFYESIVVRSKFAQDYTPELEVKTKKLVASAEKKRQQVLAKMSKLL